MCTFLCYGSTSLKIWQSLGRAYLGTRVTIARFGQVLLNINTVWRTILKQIYFRTSWK